jgi:hypothetical protein
VATYAIPSTARRVQLRNVLLLIPFGLLAAYVVLSSKGVRAVLGDGDAWRSRLRAIVALGPGEILRHTYRSLLLILAALVVLPLSISSYHSYFDYLASPSCTEVHSADCRDLRQLQVTNVTQHSAKSGEETTVDFAGGYGSATFYSDDVPPSSIDMREPVTAEVWRGAVTAVVIDGRKHLSFGSQSDAWIGIVAGAGILLVGLSWLVIDLAVASMDPDVEASHPRFASPVRRRRALYALLAIFGVVLGLFGLSLAWFGVNVAAANTLATIALVSGMLTLPLLILLFVAWFVRAYLNVGAIGLRIRHSAWFVTAALLVPPLSLYMPYRLVEEMSTKTHASLTRLVLRIWWGCAIGWAILTVGGFVSTSSDSVQPGRVGASLLLASVAVGLVAVVLTVRVISAVDATEQAVAHGAGLA